MPSDIDMKTKESLEEAIRAAFAKPAGETVGQLVPMPHALGPANVVVTARKVEVERDEAKILAKIRVMAQAAGEDWLYRYSTNNRDGSTGYIEGPSIKCANNVARMYGNCEVDTRVVDNGDSWIIYARFSDYETGFNYTRPFQQRKNQRAINAKDGGRLQEIALQIGISKAIRNVICNALETFTNFAFEEAKGAIVGKIGSRLEYYRERVLQRLDELKIDLVRVETIAGRAAKDWLASDLARIVAQLQAINDGMATADETWPPQEGTAPPRPTREQFADKPATTTVSDPIFIVTDFAGNEVEIHGGNPEHAVAAYRAVLDAAEKHGGEAALGTAIDNNGQFFMQLDELGYTDLSRELSLEGGQRRQAARENETRSNEAAARPGAGSDDPPSQQRPGDPSTVSPAGTPATAKLGKDAGEPTDGNDGPLPRSDQQPAGDLLSGGADNRKDSATAETAPATSRDIKFWGRKDGSRKLIAGDINGFMLELPQRLAECRDWSETDDVERHNRLMLNKLAAEGRAEASGMFSRRREELRGT